MIVIRPSTRAEVLARWEQHRARNRSQRSQQPPLPRPVNVRQVLDLGTLVYFQWRGRSYGVPPLPWKAGASLLDKFLEAQNLGKTIDRNNAADYYDALQQMAKVMWRCTRPVGTLQRLLKKVHLLRNPYLRATETEIAELAIFFLGCRTRVGPDRRTILPGLPVPNDLKLTTS